MAASLKDLEQQAQQLSPEDRARLAEVLLESLQGPVAADIQAAWDHEIAERVAAYDRGEATTHAAEEVFAEAKRLGR
jgi:putative addiction module component (TIGR02574 family)